MQNRLNVDVHARALRAAERVGTRIETPTLSQPWWHKYFRWEKNLTLANGRTIEKGWVVPQPLGVALIIAIIGGVGWTYSSSTTERRETRDAIIRMETMLNERTQSFREQQAELKQRMETEHRVAELQREKQNEEMRDLKASIPQRRNRQ